MKCVTLILCAHLAALGVAISDVPCETDLECAILNDRVEVVKEMLRNYPEIKHGKIEHHSPIHFAIKNKKQDMVKAIVETKPEMVNVKDYYDNTPFVYACRVYASEDLLKYLIEHGADVNGESSGHIVPLHWATHNDHEAIVKLLIEKGAAITINVRDFRGRTPIHYAAENGYERIAKLLIDNGATVNLKDNRGYTPLYLSAFHDYLNIAKMLITAGANVNEKNEFPRPFSTTLHMAAFFGMNDVVILLLKNNVDVNARNDDGQTPCGLIRNRNDRDDVRALLRC